MVQRSERIKVVLDTNTIVSAMLFSKSITRQAFNKVISHYQIVTSTAIWAEVEEVVMRKKFDKYDSRKERQVFIEAVRKKAIFYEPTETITDCRDPKDNKFLELAVAANAEFIVTGDLDLLILNPFRNISILKSGEFLNLEIA
jgi:uncharacterized protein